MDWKNLNADVNMWIGNYYGGRPNGIRGIAIHHNAGNMSYEAVYRAFSNNGTSAHYDVDNTTVCQYVHDYDRAWHAGNTVGNRDFIGIEHRNNGSNPWTVSAETLDTGAHLVAALCAYYGLGAPTWMVNVFPHSYFVATACPGELGGSQNAEYMARANQWYAEMTGSGSAPSAPAAPAPAPPAYPLPAGSYFGPKEGPVESVSGYYSHDEDLAVWQAQMAARGWIIAVDGLYGPETRETAIEFQTEKGLQVDGLIGPETWNAAWTEPVT